MNNWRVKVKGLGKIKDADIEVSPLTLFIGDNNSGKSYLMSLIYGISKLELNNNYKIDSSTKSYKEVVKWLKNINSIKEIFGRNMEESIFYNFVNILNETLMLNKERVIKSIFNTEINLDYIEITIQYNNKCIVEKIFDENNESRYLVRNNNDDVAGITFLERAFEDINYIIKCFLNYIIKAYCLNGFKSENIYLPTSRTGFLLTYKTLVGRSLADKFNNVESEKNLLTKPCSDFLIELTSIEQSKINHKYNKIINFIEDNIIEGKINVHAGPVSEYKYVPEGSNEEIPMFISSGVITEITPLLLMLKYEKDIKILMMEEPEMCLHPKLQWLIARVLVQIANTNTHVVITTHSDNILQHINNMIKLSENTNKELLMKKYHYKELDIIDKSKIKMYQFNSDKSTTEVKEIACGEFGFEASTFNNMLVSLLEQSRAFEEE